MSNATATRGPKAPTLYELAAEWRELDDALEDSGGELTSEMEADLDRLECSVSEKVERIALLIRERDRAAEAAKAEAERLAQRAAAFRKSAEGLRAYVLRCLDAAKLDRVKTPVVTAYGQTAGRPSIRWAGVPDDIPERFRKVVTEVKHDADLAYAAWKDGTLPTGFEATQKRSLILR